MYETEVNEGREPAGAIPAEALARFAETRRGLAARSLLFWGEHCTECAVPSCYATCEFYRPRVDLRCRRFVDGMVRVDPPDRATPALLKVRFDRWAKLMGWGSARLHRPAAARRRERLDAGLGAALRSLPLPYATRVRAMRRRYGQKKRAALRPAGPGPGPTAFLMECFNPGPEPIALSIIIRAAAEEERFYQARVSVLPGHHRARLDAGEIAGFVDLAAPLTVQVLPDGAPIGATLYFGVVDFVREEAPPAPAARPLKCVVWDLDNTVWRGTLVEDGADKLEPDPDVVAVIEELDRRGVLHSIASKNDPGPALEALTRFGLADYFLFPQISWGPKSRAVEEIAASLGIGRDALLFVDDSPFERAEVQAGFPEVRVLDARDAHALPERPECRLPVTPDSLRRRQLYRDQERRDGTRRAFAGDDRAFLRDCGIELRVRRLTEDGLARAHELTQRTNQLNFSGNHYDRSVLEGILANPELDAWVLDCRDRFGDQGTIGFCIVDRGAARMTDLMFSCRVRGRRVEHAFLGWLLERHRAGGGGDFHAAIRRTERNAPGAVVFAELGFEPAGSEDGAEVLAFPGGREIPDEGIVRVVGEDG